MSKVFPGLSASPFFQTPYPPGGYYAHQDSPNLLGNIEPRLRDSFDRNIPFRNSSMADPQRRSIHDMPPTRITDEYQRRQSVPQRPSREQLPPLSSIFQTTHTTTLPVRPPYPERSPSFSAVSPRTNIQAVASVRDDRHHQDHSHEHRNYTQGAPPSYPFNGRSDRQSIPHPSRTQSSGSLPGVGPQSFDSHYGTHDSSRIPSSPGNRWSPRTSESSDSFRRPSQIYSDQVYTDSRHPMPAAAARYQDPKLPYGDKIFPTSPQNTQYQPNSTSTNHFEPSSTKDSLGPKIWTGTQFLPRFVKQQEVAGEGMCYFYDDGSHCKTVIDGEVVNAHWGVTKAGKPRKRLAIACITCREKKIKCDPDYPKCVQCEKFGRLCKFKNAPRGASHGSPETTSPAELDDYMDHDSNFAIGQQEARSLDKEDADSSHSKRRKNTVNAFTPVKSEHEAPLGSTDGFRHLSSASESSLYFDTLLNAWHTDPCENNPSLASHLMAAYFTHINSGYYHIFPEQQFQKWARNSLKKKSLDDHMLVYSMLALGTMFSGKMEHKERGREFAKIGRYAADNRPPSLQLVQARFILSLYFLATGDRDASWDLCGGAIRAATGLKLNAEAGGTEDLKSEVLPFDLTSHGYSECRRRTFWSLYIMDRFNGFCFGNVCSIYPQDVFLRLPCDLRSYDGQLENTNPYFDVTSSIIQTTSNIGSMAYLITISTIWADVMSNIYRTSQRPSSLPSLSKTFYTNFHNTSTQRLEEWERSLPQHLQYSTINLNRSLTEGYFSTFVTMHTLYQVTQIKLNRYHRSSDVSSSQVERNIRKAYASATKILDITDALAENTRIGTVQGRMNRAVELATIKPEFSNPFIGYALISAVDLISAKGRREEIPQLLKRIETAKTVLNQLEVFWHSARTASRLVEKRIEELEEVLGWDEGDRRGEGKVVMMSGAKASDSGQGIWEMEESIENKFVGVMDGVYKAPWGTWISATEGCKTD